ncbi:coiled-coil domain-containing protein 130 [Heterostelium album PN500]|uniref:Coiled-coil domain-containing protein 130 n=1 Tax=Heterostelium pallidum (strain ATCC 26659 / Pp 5 / PN500) TaxID=670386 RepID=D3BLZ9_HETP5|nr:coiled-coil domain-containing protein 130 [Heterostelium album PN500]EFA77600.1 coiled-coil domain-containing protein 130 [Heterostelium album PN500]|eukprot:XP_020429728.1 coiled-coil domain-containing protein 130 [Heterostelium album PN500]
MSQATNKYYPSDWDPKHGSINKFVGSHPYGKRARKIDQGILTVRFEMPYNVWCLKCNNHIGKGVRYNAEKKQAGKYLSSKIWSFKMKCHLCDNYFEIQTDPENTEFKMVSGLRRKDESWEHDESAIPIKVREGDVESKMENDPIYRLEYVNADREVGRKMESTLTRLYNQAKSRSEHDYELSSMMRKSFREQKKEDLAAKKEQESRGITIDLLPISKQDIEEASKTSFLASTKLKAEQLRTMKREDIMSSSILPTKTKTSSTSTSSTSSSHTPKTTTTTTTTTTLKDKEEKRKEILRKKSRLDPSLFKNNKPSTIGTLFSTSLYK